MKKIKQFIGNWIYWFMILILIVFLTIIETISIIYNFIYNLIRFKKYQINIKYDN